MISYDFSFSRKYESDREGFILILFKNQLNFLLFCVNSFLIKFYYKENMFSKKNKFLKIFKKKESQVFSLLNFFIFNLNSNERNFGFVFFRMKIERWLNV